VAWEEVREMFSEVLEHMGVVELGDSELQRPVSIKDNLITHLAQPACLWYKP
jgi:hypothetical protein